MANDVCIDDFNWAGARTVMYRGVPDDLSLSLGPGDDDFALLTGGVSYPCTEAQMGRVRRAHVEYMMAVEDVLRRTT